MAAALKPYRDDELATSVVTTNRAPTRSTYLPSQMPAAIKPKFFSKRKFKVYPDS
jgi:hypothetical protein